MLDKIRAALRLNNKEFDSEKYAEEKKKLKDHLAISEDYACISKK